MLCHCAYRPTPPSSGIPSSIRIRCRDFTFVAFNFEDSEQAREAFEFIKTRTCKLGTVEKTYAFCHKPLKAEKGINGWSIYDPRAEFRRQGISEKSADRGWRISTINKDYSYCDTYPAILAVPSKISDNVLKYAREFRSRNRIPVLSYLHPVNNATITRSSQPASGILRRTNVQDEKLVAASFSATIPVGQEPASEPTPPSSQLDVSEGAPIDHELSDTERFEDELINSTALIYDEKSGKRLIYGAQQANLIVDARPTINAMVNQAQGYGSENMDHYKFAKKIFLNIANIHVMRSSLNKVIEAIKDADISPLPPNREQLAASGWLKHTYSVLDGASIIVRQVGVLSSHVLIHCSDGWDRTSQLSALAQLMLDPYYRSIEGFIVLVEKDWLSFGHMFRLRSGHLNHQDWFVVQRDSLAGQAVQPGENDGGREVLQNVVAGAKRLFQGNKDEDLDAIGEAVTGKDATKEATDPRMVSPVFHQFLDCVYQLLRQNPNRFEFNERFLRRLLYHLYACQYGTFLYNSEKQRHDANVQERTSSVWDYFLARKREFTNPDYDSTVDDTVKGKERIIIPHLSNVRWWHQSFNRSDEEMNGALNAQAAADNERATAIASFQSAGIGNMSVPGTPPHAQSPRPPGLPTSQSVLVGVEMAHENLTPDRNTPSFQRSASADNPGAFTAIRDGIAGLGIGRGMMSTVSSLTARSGGPSGAGSSSTSPVPSHRGEQELREMT
jgi:myotubularin-related protein 6/7/8